MRYVGFKLWVSINHVRYRKTYVYFLFKYCLVRRRLGVQIGYQFKDRQPNDRYILLCLSDSCCFYKRLSPGRSKTYVTFDITEESCT